MSNLKADACMTIEDLSVGQKYEMNYVITYEEVLKFSQASGDFNPVHHDEEYAATTVFKKRIAHGLLSVAKFSAIFGMHMPGLGAVYLHQSADFKAPVYLDTPYVAIAEIVELDREKNLIVVSTKVLDLQGNEIVCGQGRLKPVPVKVRQKMNPKLWGGIQE